MQTVIVTGSQGFIGGYIVSELLRQNYHVIGIDNFSKYGRVEKSHDVHPNFTLIEEDLAHSNQKLIGVLYEADHLIVGAAKIGDIFILTPTTYWQVTSESWQILATQPLRHSKKIRI
jgi:nucleoside-diphosphate-sugar epimerase